jgi:integrase
MTEWQTSNRKGLYVRPAKRCGARHSRRCSCEPSYRGERRNPVTRQPEYSPISKQRSEILTSLEGGHKATEAVRERRADGPTFGELARRWRAGVENGSIAKRRGRGRYSPTTWRRYGHSLDYTLLPVRSERFPLGEGFGDRVASHIEAADWQAFIDRCARRGLKRSTINNHMAAVNAIYSWAAYPTRRLVAGNRGRPALRDRLLRRPTPLRARAPRVGRRRPRGAADPRTSLQERRGHQPPRPLRRAAAAAPARGLPAPGPTRRRTRARRDARDELTLPERADRAWRGHDPPLWRVTLHECRHTYASYLMAAGCTLREIMEYLGHSSLSATERYVKLLPQPAEGSPAEGLNAYVARAAEHPGW